MNENVGASFGLSLLTVGFFTVVLYQPENPPPPVAAVPAATPVEAVEAHPPEAAAVPPPVAARPVERATTVARPVSRRQARAADPEEPRGVFTRVRAGETLADVARRVYGAEAASKRLWAANRDLLDRPDAPLSTGSVLRTP